MLGAILQHVQCNGLHGRPAIAAVRAFTVHVGEWHEGVEVHANYALDGVDQGDRVAATGLCRTGGPCDVRDVGCELHDDGDLRHLLHPLHDHLQHLGLLADSATHTTFAHAVRTTEVQLDAISTGVLHIAHDVVPFVAGLHHQRGDHRVVREALFHLGDLAQVVLQRPVGDQLDVVEPHHTVVAVVHGAVSAAHIHHGYAEGLPHSTAPACVEGFHDLIAAVRWWS